MFEAVSRRGSLTGAASELNIAQSAVSRHVAELERRIGQPLLRRNGNRFTMTSGGIELAEAAARALRDLDRVVRDLRPRSDDVFVLGCSPDIAEAWLMPRYHRILAALDGRHLRLQTSVDYSLFDGPDIDLSIRFGTKSDWPDFHVALLFPGSWFPVLSPALAERFREEIESEGFDRIPLLHLGANQGAPGGWRHWLGADRELPGSSFSSFTPMIHAALAGEGAALAWSGFVDSHIEAGRLMRIGTRTENAPESFYLLARTPLRTPTIAVIETLRASVTPNGRGRPGT
ncbi:LysR family transcriptional regulator [Sphingopyxis terrae]|nr:LysR family transcriptional regulator [Sphingopyxis terrae]MDX8356497.1 LysR family transcriptional regulator [Sphingopyxis terrae]